MEYGFGFHCLNHAERGPIFLLLGTTSSFNTVVCLFSVQ
jgi:hypothetical protein